MASRSFLRVLALGAIILCLGLHAQATAFTYQGQLKALGIPPTGTYDFQFSLYDTVVGGVALGTVTLGDVVVTNGLFTVQLDFGAGAFPGAARWLGIFVRPGDSTGGYTALTPRQPLTPEPYAISAETAQDAWKLGGNSGTTPGIHFLGTTDNQALEIRVNGLRALRLVPHATSPNLIGGCGGNWLTSGVYGATIGGGGDNGGPNAVTDTYGTIAGGWNNRAGDNAGSTTDAEFATVGGGSINKAGGPWATVGGGYGNTASGGDATVGGGGSNTASGGHATVAGGVSNTASSSYAAVGGGYHNAASGIGATVAGGANNAGTGAYATVPGGSYNTADGVQSFAAGQRAKANHAGAFVWGDGTAADVASTAINQFIVRASGGIWLGTTSSPSIPAGRFLNTSTGAYLTTGGTWTNYSDRAQKDGFMSVNPREVLRKLAGLPITRWHYKAEGAGTQHLGPVAQDFHAAFGLGQDDVSISTVDADGVALAAIQGLYQQTREENGALKARIAALEARLAALEAGVAKR